uniref:Glycosyltransferase 2-like domain-containing protein n=1 Tax=Chromera velia CCMP2878 TaxID=1169474 RepID=A0A0G4GW69_9ALVE|eukprot:Cvel_23659.t1-p1 / transcript=Cvel_23659.t1 / gene=Cvel_23659 / organism=Chromera_velia_CCMP2878 / gene_product=hypothetical protein / transcript_product=hypothetical protein / location=Cvel_scaffold2463:12674-18661(-) / protein_length=612 / sequence_SO=supercontig / SO=protein_coding / is_pseudo=false
MWSAKSVNVACALGLGALGSAEFLRSQFKSPSDSSKEQRLGGVRHYFGRGLVNCQAGSEEAGGAGDGTAETPRRLPEQLIVFAKYPVPGTCKTRLADVLGPSGAALAYKDMAEDTLETAAELNETRGTHVNVFFTGCKTPDFRQWVKWVFPNLTKPFWSLTKQPVGNLGERLAYAFGSAFVSGSKVVAAIGSDCPSVTSEVLEKALNLLQERAAIDDGTQNPLCVLGKAKDGGYYLVGLSEECGKIFEGISWSSDRVFEETVRRCKENGVDVAVLEEELEDVDDGKQLKMWEEVRVEHHPHRSSRCLREDAISLGVVIPTLNEESSIASLLRDLVDKAEGEATKEIRIVVADGGSEDGTRVAVERFQQELEEQAKKQKQAEQQRKKGSGGLLWGGKAKTNETSCEKEFSSSRSVKVEIVDAVGGRGWQLNEGASAAGDVDLLLFLHADSRVQKGYDVAISCALLSDPLVSLGAFRFLVDRDGASGLRSRLLSVVEWGVRWRCTQLGLPFGDQGFFLRRESFEKVGRFRSDHPIFEDFELAGRLRQTGKVVVAEVPLTVSRRRWDKHGVFKVTFLNSYFIALYKMGMSPAKLYKRYYGRDAPECPHAKEAPEV